MVAVIIWLSFAAVSWLIADTKNRNPWGWGIAGFFFGPFAAVIVLAMPKLKEVK